MNVTKCLVVIVILAVTCTSCCVEPYPTTPIEVELMDMSLCEGQTAEGVPIILRQPVPPNQTRICVCGHLKKDWGRDITLQVLWGYEEERLQRSVREFGDGSFVDCVERKDGFEAGEYYVLVMAYQTVIGDMDFLVGE